MTISLRRARVAIFAPLLVIGLFGCNDNKSQSQAKSWPEIQVENIDGATVNTAEFNSDKVLVVSLWSTWCVPCRRELPQLQQFANENMTVSIVAVNLGDDAPSVRGFADELGLTLPILLDSYGRISSALGVASVPATVLIRDKSVIATHLGEISAKQLAELIDQNS